MTPVKDKTLEMLADDGDKDNVEDPTTAEKAQPKKSKKPKKDEVINFKTYLNREHSKVWHNGRKKYMEQGMNKTVASAYASSDARKRTTEIHMQLLNKNLPKHGVG